MAVEITTGDDASLSIALKYNDSPFVVDSGATVKASLTTLDRVKLTADISCSNTTDGADWSNGVIIVEVPSAETGSMTVPESGRVLVEMQVEQDGKKRTFWSKTTIRVYEGTIP